MDPRSLPGFLGTAASRASDISLVAYVLLIVPAMLLGYAYARRKVYANHQLVMSAVVIINWVIIAYLMAVRYAAGVAPRLPGELGRPGVFLPTIHLVTGLLAQIIATILMAQMWLGPLVRFRLEPIKPWMRLTLTLWLITAILGISIYLTWFGVPFSKAQGTIATPPPGTPIATPEVTSSR